MLGSHERFRPLLDRLRSDLAAWAEAAYQENEETEEEDWSDLNYRVRFGVLRCLQFDRRPEDEPLIRFLFAEEIKAREADPFQGGSSALELAAFLLAVFRRPLDLGLFWNAKRANFDTHSSFDPEYLYRLSADIENLDALRSEIANLDADGWESLREYLEERKAPTPENLALWWEHKSSAYPADLAQEPVMSHYYAAWEMEDTDTARSLLNLWASQHPADSSARYWRTLAYECARLGDYAAAYEAQNQLIAASQREGESGWAIRHARDQLANYAMQVGFYGEAFALLAERTQQVIEENQLDVGVARATAESLFDLAIVAVKGGAPAIARRAFDLGGMLRTAGVAFPRNALQKGGVAAHALGLRFLATRYAKWAEEKQRRITRDLSCLPRKG